MRDRLLAVAMLLAVLGVAAGVMKSSERPAYAQGAFGQTEGPPTVMLPSGVQPTSTDGSWALDATCGSYSSYTTHYRPKDSDPWKPIIYIWGLPKRNGAVDPTGIGIYYWDEIGGWIQVPVSSVWGIQTVVQHQYEQWTGYYIATRWYLLHPKWNDDWRWRVYICR